jgi:glycosyltransferase involved in cell wall biosynthesis
VLAIWRGSQITVGGALTHESGILSGFRDAGYRIALVTAFPVAEQLAQVVDEVVVVPPLPRHARVNSGLAHLALNAPLRETALKLGERIKPAFVYQRHAYFVGAGVEIASLLRVPLVLEWNGSEVFDWWHVGSHLLPRRLAAPLVRAAAMIEEGVVSRATVVAAVAEPARDMAIEAGAKPKNVIVVPNGVRLAAIDATLSSAHANPMGPVTGIRATLGWVGSFGPWHGAEMVVRVLGKLPADIAAVMIGDGVELNQCRALAEKLGVAGRVEFTGELPHPSAVQRLAACDVLVSSHVGVPGTSFYGSPTKIFEYMAIGKPIVAASLGQIGSVLHDGTNARLFPPGDLEAFARAIDNVLASSDKGASLAAQARKDAAEQHSWLRRAELILNALESVF